MNYLKKAAVCMTAAAMFAVNSVGFTPCRSIELPAITANAADIVESGECGVEGDDVVWELDCYGLLRISGKGYMPDYTGTESIFAGNTNIRHIIVEADVKSIGSGAFLNCSNLNEVELPHTVHEIGKDAFKGCDNLREINVPNYNCEIFDSPDTIPDSATIFANNGSLAYKYAKKYGKKNTQYPVVAIKDGVCENGVEWYIISGGYLQISGEGIMNDYQENEKSPWSEYNNDIKHITINEKMTSIGDYAFYDLDNTMSVGIRDGVTKIGKNAFAMCSNLSKVKLHKNIEEVGTDAFKSCSAMKNIIVENPECVIGDSADTFPDTATIYGYEGSTAQTYAEKYSRKFIALDENPETAPVTTTATTTASTTTSTTTTTNSVTTALGVVSTDCKITINTLPTKTVYDVGEELDLDGGKISFYVDVTFTDGTTEHEEKTNAEMRYMFNLVVDHASGRIGVPYIVKADTSEVDMSVPGEYPVIVKALDAMQRKVYTSETFNITVKEAATTISTTTTTKPTTLTTTTTEKPTTTSTTTTTFTTTKPTTTTTSTTTKPTTTTTPPVTEPPYTLGDLNDDGTVDASDASLVLAEYAKIQTGVNPTFTASQTNAADVNKDNVVDSSDASKILVYYAMISTGKEPTWD